MATEKRALKYILKLDLKKYYPAVYTKKNILAAIARARKGYKWRGKED